MLSKWHSKLLIRVAVISFIATISLHGAGLDYLAQKASTIVVGSVDGGVEGPTQVSFTITVTRVLKGNSQLTGQKIPIIHPWSRAGIVRPPVQSVNQQISGIWFLTGGPPEGWDVLNSRPSKYRTFLGLFLPASATPPTGPYAYPLNTPTLDALVYEVAVGVAVANEDPSIITAAFYAVDTRMDTTAVRKVLATCIASGNPALQVVGIAGNLERAVPDAIQELVKLWPNISTDPNVGEVVAALSDSWRDATPGSVQQLAAFAATAPSGSDIRRAAVRALASIHSRESLPFLASLLSSADRAEQERAVYGMSAFVNGCPMQTRDNVLSMSYLECNQGSSYKNAETSANFGFRPGPPDQEAALVSFWQSWWNSHAELH